MTRLYLGATPDVAERDICGAIGMRVADTFGVSLRPLNLPPVDFALDPARNQYGSIPVLEMLSRSCPQDAQKVVAVTGRDLFVPVLTFVYGHAQLGGRVAVVSLARLRQEFYGLPRNPAVFLERAVKETLHETGHAFGLVHCPDRTCAMALSTNIRQIDLKRGALCRNCAARLRA